MLERRRHPTRSAYPRHQKAWPNRLAEEERLRSSRPRRTRYSALQAHHRMRHESACAGATKDPSVGQCVCAEHNVRSWHAGVGEDLRSAGNGGRHNLIPIYATTPSFERVIGTPVLPENSTY